MTPFPKDNIKVLEGGWGYIPYHLLPALVSTLNLLLSAVSKQGPEHSFSVSAALPSALLLYSSNRHSARKQTILYVSSASMLVNLDFWLRCFASLTPSLKRSTSFLWHLIFFQLCTAPYHVTQWFEDDRACVCEEFGQCGCMYCVLLIKEKKSCSSSTYWKN